MPPPEQVGADAGFRPENRMMPSPQLEMEKWKASMRVGDNALELFVPENVEASEWASEEPYEDPEGFPVLPGKLNEQEAVEWKRPSELGLGELPIWSRIAQSAGDEENGAAGGEGEEPQIPDPVIAKPPKRNVPGQMIELHCKALSNPLTEDHAFVYHLISAISVARSLNQSTGQDMWDQIYPKNDRGQAIYNASGQYVVRLFVLGQWRCVRVDDRLPCVNGECILPRTQNKAELWPMLISKAILKVMSVPGEASGGEGEDGEDEEVPRRLMDLSHQQSFTFMVTCLTGWQPEEQDVLPCDSWENLRGRMSKGNVCPLVWGSHPQERMKYIGSLNEDGVGGGDEPPPPHWDVCNDTALFVKPNFSRSDGEVEILVPRLSWHLPPLPDKPSPPAAEGEEEGEEGEGEPADAEATKGEGGGEEGGGGGGGDKEPAKAKTVFLKPPVDFKYQCPVQDFVSAFSRFIFFHNPRGYAHQASYELPSVIPPEAGEATEEGGDEGPSPEAAALAAARALAPVGLFIANDTGDAQDALLCFSSSIFGAPLLVTRQNQEPLVRLTTSSSTAAIIPVPPGKHSLRLHLPLGLAFGLQASSEATLRIGPEHLVAPSSTKVSDVAGAGPSEITPGSEQMWMRRSLKHEGTLQVDFFCSDTTIAPVVQVSLVHNESGAAYHSRDGRIGPISVSGDHTLIVRSLAPLALPEGYEPPEAGITFLLRCTAESAVELTELPCDSFFDANGYYVPNVPKELFRFAIEPPDADAEGATNLCVSACLRTLSPAIVSLQLLCIARGQEAWSTTNVDPVVGRSRISAERDGVITATPVRYVEDRESVEILEVVIPPASAAPPPAEDGGEEGEGGEGKEPVGGKPSYELIGRLIRREKLVVKKIKEATPAEGEGEGEGEGAEEGAAVAAAPAAGEVEYEDVTNEVDEPGQDPFWTLRVFTTGASEEIVSRSTAKFDRMDQYLGECRESETREAFVESLKPAEPAAPPAEGEEGEAPAGEEGGEEGGDEEAEPPAVWPPIKDAEQTWEEYFTAYKEEAPSKSQPSVTLIKADPALNGVPSRVVVTPEEFGEREKGEEGEREGSEERWAKHKEGREAKKEERAKWLEGLKEDLNTKAAKAEEEVLKPADGNVLGKRVALIRLMKDTSAFLAEVYESIAKAEQKVEDVEDSDPPAQKVNTSDEETISKLLHAIDAVDEEAWKAGVDALKEAGYLETESETCQVSAVARYHKERAQWAIGKEHKRVCAENRAEEERIRKEEEEAAAAAAAEDEAEG